jgi:hypothetical protein
MIFDRRATVFAAALKPGSAALVMMAAIAARMCGGHTLDQHGAGGELRGDACSGHQPGEDDSGNALADCHDALSVISGLYGARLISASRCRTTMSKDRTRGIRRLEDSRRTIHQNSMFPFNSP